MAQPYQDHVRKARILAARDNSILQVSKSVLACHLSRRNRHVLVMKQERGLTLQEHRMQNLIEWDMRAQELDCHVLPTTVCSAATRNLIYDSDTNRICDRAGCSTLLLDMSLEPTVIVFRFISGRDRFGDVPVFDNKAVLVMAQHFDHRVTPFAVFH